LSSESDWPALLQDYEAAVRNFESVSAALIAVLSAQYPPGADLLDLIAAEERSRESVVIARMRLIHLWRESLDEAHPLFLSELQGAPNAH
jgi:hypothetical protein